MKRLLLTLMFAGAGLAACTAAPTAPSRNNNSFSDGGNNDVSTAAETVASTAVEATVGGNSDAGEPAPEVILERFYMPVETEPEAALQNPDAGEIAPVVNIALQPPTAAQQAEAEVEELNPIVGVATGADAKTLTDLGATTNLDGSVTLREANMDGSDPAGL